MAFRNIRIKGLKATMSKSGKSAKVWIRDFDVLDVLKEALEKRPVWKNDYNDDEREFIITNFGISEVYDDDAKVPENFDNTKEDVQEEVPF